MANAEHVEILRTQATDWAKWKADNRKNNIWGDHHDYVTEHVLTWNVWRREHPHILPDLSAAILAGLDLSHSNLCQVNFSQASLVRCNLDFSYLDEANLNAPLRSALNQAVKWHLIAANPCAGVELPKHKAREIQPFTREQAARLMAVRTITRVEPDGRTVTVENKHRTLFCFMLTVGCRPSEAFALKWSDIDFDRATVTIQRSVEWLSKKQGGSWRFKETKTASSRRCVPLPVPLLQQLREHRAAQHEALLKIGVRTDLVFASSEGGPLQAGNLRRRFWRPALKAAGIPEGFGLYSARHTVATLLLQAGVSAKVTAERLGHSSIRLTMDTYSHVMPGMQSEATAQLERILYG